MTLIQKINPINKEQEKKKFLFDPLYNPQFEYEEEIDPDEYDKFGSISDRYLSEATFILDSLIKKFGTEQKYLDEVEGEVMERSEVEDLVQKYLKDNAISTQLKVVFSRKFVSRTSINDKELSIRLPIDYRKKAFPGILDHEIGTHYFRRLNENLSPWYKNRKEYGMSNYMETEEGLAVIHQMLDLEYPYLWLSSLYYIGSWWGASESFSTLNKNLEKYIQDPERRWKMCLRIKRGLKDTSQPGSFSRNQNYLTGVIRVLQYLEANDYNPRPLYAGKIDIKDVGKSQGDRQIILPKFLETINTEKYKKDIVRLKKLNFLHT